MAAEWHHPDLGSRTDNRALLQEQAAVAEAQATCLPAGKLNVPRSGGVAERRLAAEKRRGLESRTVRRSGALPHVAPAAGLLLSTFEIRVLQASLR
ncbi:hypothetical protein GN956_G5621 [Arapaima gigas]